MKRSIVLVAFAATLAVATARAADVGFDVNIRVGNQPAPAVPVPVPAPPPTVVIEEPPVFVYPPALGFYVAVGVPYDLFFTGNYYYLQRGGVWYRSYDYGGPWAAVQFRQLPPGLRRHKFERIVVIRDEEFRRYKHDRDHYEGRHFRPDKEWKERRKEEKREWKEEKREMKEERKHGKGHGRHGED